VDAVGGMVAAALGATNDDDGITVNASVVAAAITVSKTVWDVNRTMFVCFLVGMEYGTLCALLSGMLIADSKR